MTDDELLALHRLSVDYGRDWHIWRSAPTPSGRTAWYASRRRLWERDTARGLWPTVAAETLEDLRRELEAQARAAESPAPPPDAEADEGLAGFWPPAAAFPTQPPSASTNL